MTPAPPEEEARRDEALRICEELAQRHMRSQMGDAPVAGRLDVESTIGQRILAVAKPSEPPSPWPLDLGYGTSIYLREGENRFFISGGQGGMDWMYASPGGMARLRNALVADASDAEKDALLVALCGERGIDLKRIANFIASDPTEETTICDTHNTIRAVLDNAAEQEAD